MRIDHCAYRVKDREGAVKFFQDAFGYKIQTEFDINLEDGSTAKCTALEPSEKSISGIPFTSIDINSGVTYHLAPEIFVSSGPEGSLIDKWVNDWGRGTGGIHHIAYQCDDVQKTMDEWIAKGWLFTTPAPLDCEDLTQVFTRPNPYTGIIYEFINRRGTHGFCKDNVSALMSSTKGL
jgi:4-hydroxyphenylpyruvate dioxygenase-like putative hemolysin